jgi:hypothetical protein
MQGRIAPFIEEIKIDYMKENIIELDFFVLFSPPIESGSRVSSDIK